MTTQAFVKINYLSELKQYLKIFCFLGICLILGACRALGIHFKVENPKKAGSYPKMSKALELLAKTNSKRTNYDVTYYQLNLTINPMDMKLSGLVNIHSKVLYSLDTIQVDLHKNLLVKTIKLNGQLTPYLRIEGAIWILPPEKLKPDQTFTITVEYEGKPPIAKNPPWEGGMVWKKDKLGKFWCGVACETEGASLWWPNKDEVSDEADSADVNITTGNNLIAVSNGTFIDSTINLNNTKTFRWHISYPINNYNITFYIGDFKCIKDTFVSKVTHQPIYLSYFVLPHHTDSAKKHFQQVKSHLAFYEKKFGTYPWPKDGFKFVESPYEGMEHQSAIAYGNGYKNGGDGFDYIILHETAHEWWGNSVTAADLGDAWLQEGFASYAEALFVEETKGTEAYLNYMYWQRITIANQRPVARPRGMRFFSYKDEDIYGKGSWVLHSLRTVLNNDSLFFDILKSFRIQYHCKQILTEDFISFVNQKTKTNYQWFFNQYVFRREAPIFEFYWQGQDFYFRWIDVNDDFVEMPVELNFGGRKKIIYPNKKVQKIVVEPLLGQRVTFSDDRALFGYKENKKLVFEM